MEGLSNIAGLANPIAGGIQGLTGIISGVSKFFEGKKMQREAVKALNSFEWQELNNAHKNRQVSTLGSDLKTEEATRLASTSVEALRGGGTRGLVGGLGRVVANNNQINRENAVDLDRQQMEINRDMANDEANIRAMQERRQAEELKGYGQQLQVGRATKYSGINEIGNAVGTMGAALSGLDKQPESQPTNPTVFGTPYTYLQATPNVGLGSGNALFSQGYMNNQIASVNNNQF